MIKNEWKSLLRNKLMLIVVIAIIVIPIIYAGLFLKSMWEWQDTKYRQGYGG